MANTYTQLYVHFVFSVKGRECLIKSSFRDEMEKVMCGIVANHQCKALAVYCMPDHTHLLVSIHPTMSSSRLMEAVKSGTSKWLNEKGYLPGKFSWQNGYGAFTYAKSQLDRVVNYILNQPQHHKKQTFREEYLLFLKKYEVEFDERYLFDFLE